MLSFGLVAIVGTILWVGIRAFNKRRNAGAVTSFENPIYTIAMDVLRKNRDYDRLHEENDLMSFDEAKAAGASLAQGPDNKTIDRMTSVRSESWKKETFQTKMDELDDVNHVPDDHHDQD